MLFEDILKIGTSMYQNWANRKAIKENNAANIKMQQEENAITRAREDNAHQREVADLQKAGLNPLASISGSSASAGGVIGNEAPQMDLSGVQEGLTQLAEMEQRKDEFEETKRQFDKNLTHEQKILEETKREFDEAQENTIKIKNADLKMQVMKINAEFERGNDELEASLEENSKDRLIKLAEQSEQEYEAFCKLANIRLPVEEYTDIDKYAEAKKEFMAIYSDMLKQQDQLVNTDPTTSESNNVNGKAGVVSGGGGTSWSANDQGRSTSNFVNSWMKEEYITNEKGEFIKNKKGKPIPKYKGIDFKFPIFVYRDTKTKYNKKHELNYDKIKIK